MTSKYVQKPGIKEFRPVSNLLKNLSLEFDDGPADQELQRLLLDRWSECAGKAAISSFPLLFRSGRLVIFTDSAIWATELRHRRQAIEAGLGDIVVTEISVRVSPTVFSKKIRGSRKVHLSRKNGMHLSNSASTLKHSGLRDAVIRLSRRSDNR